MENMDKAGLIKKLAQIVQEIDHVEKRGRNEFHRYDYVKAADLANIVRDKLSARNVLMLSDVVSSERFAIQGEKGDSIAVYLMVEYTFLDGDTGASLSFKVPGCGADKGDKGVYKALTGSLKYAIRNAFLVPDESDPENEGGQSDPVTTKIINAFREFGVTVSQLETKLGHNLSAMTDADSETLRVVYQDLKSGTPKDKLFPPSTQPPASPPTPVAPPPVDHTPAQPTDEPRPGEKKGRGRPAKKRGPEPVEKPVGTVENPVQEDPPVEQPAETAPAASAPVQKADEPASDDYRRQIRERVGVYINKLGADPLKTWMLRFTGARNTQEMTRAQWDLALAELEAKDKQGVQALTDMVKA